MENRLKKRLEILKRRAERMRENEECAQKANGEVEPAGQKIPEPEHRVSEELPPVGLEEAAPGTVDQTGRGTCYRISLSNELVDGCGEGESRRFERLAGSDSALRTVFGRQARPAPAPVSPKRIAFFDIETAGLSPTTYLFLCGVLFVADGRYHIEQLLARDYPEEAAMLDRLNHLFRQFDYVVTYNGRSFDLPFTRARMAVNRIDFSEAFTTLDLLGPTRKAFSRVLPNCRLGTVEYYLTGRERTGDVPGRDIPRVYHDFVHSGDARTLAGVLYHNRMDLLTMVIIFNELLR